tara:strand:+ start:3005 stop:3655 length:651 start_codon:yes stop_codon:yes gene_type:complete
MKAADIISINCGGKIFQTTPNTLAKSDLLVAQYNQISDDEKDLFLDKDPKTFYYILEIMREDLEFEDIPYQFKQKVFKLLDFLLMQYVIEHEHWFRIHEFSNLNNYVFDRITSTSSGVSGDIASFYEIKAKTNIAKIFISFLRIWNEMKIQIAIYILGKQVFCHIIEPTKTCVYIDVGIELLRSCHINVKINMVNSGHASFTNNLVETIQLCTIQN